MRPIFLSNSIDVSVLTNLGKLLLKKEFKS
jgi:hypothetical protein